MPTWTQRFRSGSRYALLCLAIAGALPGCGGGGDAPFQNRELPYTYLGEGIYYFEARDMGLRLVQVYQNTKEVQGPENAYRYTNFNSVIRSVAQQTTIANDERLALPSDAAERALFPDAKFFATQMLVYVNGATDRVDRLTLTKLEEKENSIEMSFFVCALDRSPPDSGPLRKVFAFAIPTSPKPVVVLPLAYSTKPPPGGPSPFPVDIGGC